ncbi:MAG TPA: stage II sporulation protein M, partial [Xanthomonadales bacterium]|nr:stage II sporulation protein M [Xanthomonadales bacterium]
MKQTVFEARHADEWSALERWLDKRARPKRADRHRDEPDLLGDVQFPEAYRRACQHLALAQRRGYSSVLIERLHELVHRGHLVLYRPPPPRWQKVLTFFMADFPRLVRAQWAAMLVSGVLFFAPLIAAIFVLQQRPELVHTVFEPAQLAEFEKMYDPAAAHGKL